MMSHLRLKKIMTAFCCLILFSTAFSQEFSDISLPPPQQTGGMPLMEALSQRQSKRAFSNEELSLQHVSDLLWAAFGINRTENGKRTAPTASNAQEIDVYISTKQGIYLYDVQRNEMKTVVAGDFRSKMGRQAFVGEAPVVLIFVADFERMSPRLNDERKAFYAATDVGYISQNVYLFAASEGLATVVIGAFNPEHVAEALPLRESQRVILTQPVGHPQ